MSGVIVCPACGSAMLRDRGPLPPTPKTFGGQSVEEALPSGHLLACTNCGLQFRNPYPPDEQLLALYEGLSDAVWALDEPHPVWPLILDMMEEAAPPRAVLDIGCFRGDFLAWLPERMASLWSGAQPEGRRIRDGARRRNAGPNDQDGGRICDTAFRHHRFRRDRACARSSLSAGLYERSTRAGWTNNSSDGRDRELALPAARSQLLVLLAAGARDLL